MSVLDSVHYSSQGVREQTQELASWALGDTDTFRAGPLSTRHHAASDASLQSRPRLSSLTGDSDTDVHNVLDPSVPEAIEEVSEPQSPDSQTRDVPAGSHSSALTHMLQTSSRDEAEDYMEARRRRENKDTGRNRAPSIVIQDESADEMREDTALLPKARLSERSDKRQYGTTSESSRSHTGTRDRRARARDQITAVLHTVASPKSWDKRMIWRKAVVEPAKTAPAVFLGWLLNILDALSYGMVRANILQIQPALIDSRHDLIPSWREAVRTHWAGRHFYVLRELYRVAARVLTRWIHLQGRRWFRDGRTRARPESSLT